MKPPFGGSALVDISCTVFVSFSSGHSEIATTLAIRVHPSHSLPPVSQQTPFVLRNLEMSSRARLTEACEKKNINLVLSR